MKVKTKIDQSGVATETQVTIDWETFTEEQLRSQATKALVILAQRRWREDGNIPGSYTITAADLEKKKAEKDPVKAVENNWTRMSPEEQKNWLEARMAEAKREGLFDE